MSRRALLGVALLLIAGACEDDPIEPAQGASDPCERVDSLDALPAPASYAYDWSCSGEVPPDGLVPEATEGTDDCTTGIWPDLDERTHVCPTESDITRDDPDSGLTLPRDDPRSLPTTIPVSEAGSFLPPGGASFPADLRVVSWNVEYSRSLDTQITTLTTHPDLSGADVYLLSEVDRCSTRNGVRRAARELAEALEGDYVYGIEFVELSIDRDIGGDTGQAIVSRRPLTGAVLTCHSRQEDWFASDGEPRLGQRVVLHADIPAGDTSVRVYSVHLESNDFVGDRRAPQSKEMLDAAQALACDRPQIAAGDFNAPYCGAPELQVLKDAGFVDAVAIAGDVEPTHANGLRLDYIFSRGFEVLGGGAVRGLDASDHDPVWADLRLVQ